MHRAPNVIGVTNCFNRISAWAVYTVLFGKTIEDRINKWHFFSKLAQALWDTNNFLDSVAIAMGLNSSPIYRLAKHKAKAEQGDRLKSLADILATSSNEHGSELIECETDKQKKGEAIPFIATFLGQLTFTYDGNPDELEGLVNFTKCVLVFNLIDKILSFKIKEFHFIEIEQIQNKLNHLPEADENELYARSLQIEPQGMSDEDFEALYNTEKSQGQDANPTTESPPQQPESQTVSQESS